MSDAPADEDAPEEDDDSTEEPLDQLGIPMRREPTLDDVRSDGQQHRQLAFGCSVLVSLAVLLFTRTAGFWRLSASHSVVTRYCGFVNSTAVRSFPVAVRSTVVGLALRIEPELTRRYRRAVSSRQFLSSRSDRSSKPELNMKP